MCVLGLCTLHLLRVEIRTIFHSKSILKRVFFFLQYLPDELLRYQKIQNKTKSRFLNMRGSSFVNSTVVVKKKNSNRRVNPIRSNMLVLFDLRVGTITSRSGDKKGALMVRRIRRWWLHSVVCGELGCMTKISTTSRQKSTRRHYLCREFDHAPPPSFGNFIGANLWMLGCI